MLLWTLKSSTPETVHGIYMVNYVLSEKIHCYILFCHVTINIKWILWVSSANGNLTDGLLKSNEIIISAGLC